jgi:hypothetical protein
VDLDLMLPNQTLADFTARALVQLDRVYSELSPDLVLVQGDTTTVLAASLGAFYRRVPIGHVEAGLRTFDLNAPWPEEANRVLTTDLATLHFVPTALSEKNLLREGISSDRIYVTGNTVIDALFLAVKKVRSAGIEIPGLNPEIMDPASRRPLVLITGHRRESFGDKLRSICRAVDDLAPGETDNRASRAYAQVAGHDASSGIDYLGPREDGIGSGSAQRRRADPSDWPAKCGASGAAQTRTMYSTRNTPATMTITIVNSANTVLFTFNPVVSGNAWSVTVPGTDHLPDGSYTIKADVSDEGTKPPTQLHESAEQAADAAQYHHDQRQGQHVTVEPGIGRQDRAA